MIMMSDSEVEIDNYSVEPACTDNYDDSIPVIETVTSYQDFFNNFLLCNRPCLMKDFISYQWECRSLWVDGLKPNLSYLKEAFGETKVPVADCNEREYNSQKKTMFTLYEYVDYLERLQNNGYPPSEPNLYLKDWHFTRDFPNTSIYRVPKYFSCDWLNEYFTARADLSDDYRFVYFGPKGSWTPLHADVFTSYSWSVNIVGQKRWVLFPPGHEMHLRDKFGNLAYDILSQDIHNETQYPFCNKSGKVYDVIQEAGEGIFVPSGWHHQVWNLEDTISINHNWINGCNVQQIWKALSSCLSAVQEEVSDCRDMDDWDSHCQLMLRATHGLNFEEFFDFLQCIAEPRLKKVQGHGEVKMFGAWELGFRHAAWDLKQISATLSIFLTNPNLQNLSWIDVKKPTVLKETIDELLGNLETDRLNKCL